MSNDDIIELLNEMKKENAYHLGIISKQINELRKELKPDCKDNIQAKNIILRSIEKLKSKSD